MIVLRDVVQQYGGRVVLEIPELRFVPGRRYGLIGENGSGKTTLIRMLAGTSRPTSGRIEGLEGKKVGYLPQSPYAFSFSVLENVALALDGGRDAKEIARKALVVVGMESLMEARGDRLSGGEAQRMALARVLMRSYNVLLLDEPTSSTDVRSMDLIENTLREYVQKTQCTLIFSTHAPAQALRLADEVLYLEKGRLVEQGPAQALFHSPQDERTKAFLRHWSLNS
ncbi:MAG TPA: ABC transporter ATP-binding protein [Anaerolineaceae bacterium]|nr:ABC transporter ATP-binding protein [Anaerolineaceae bacterium]HQJ33192.1 ABC transporter ATP-binding protein [Anaerolineaceae bacterium]